MNVDVRFNNSVTFHECQVKEQVLERSRNETCSQTPGY